MNSFQILDKEGKPIPIKDLDKQACDFWQQEVHTKWYAHPQKRREDEDEFSYISRQGNWFDIVGWNIANQGNECSGWANVVASMIAMSLGMKFIDTSEGYADRPVAVRYYQDKGKTLELPKNLEMSIHATLEFYKPYIDLINHWQSFGYQPKVVKE